MKRLCSFFALTLLACIAYAQTDTIVVNNKRYVVVDEVPIQEQNVQQQKVQEQTTTTPKKKSTFWTKDKITYGGSFGFTLNKHEYYLMVMPEVGYQLFRPWHFGVAPKYAYSGDYYNSYGEHTLGVRVSTRFEFTKIGKWANRGTHFFILAAYIYEHRWESSWYNYGSHFFDAGIGLTQRVGQRGTLYAMAGWHLYDGCHDAWFIDAIPTISVGFQF